MPANAGNAWPRLRVADVIYKPAVASMRKINNAASVTISVCPVISQRCHGGVHCQFLDSLSSQRFKLVWTVSRCFIQPNLNTGFGPFGRTYVFHEGKLLVSANMHQKAH
jgi:hypothetical protein